MIVSWMDSHLCSRGAPIADLPESVQEWIARAILLEDVPFQYLVPDERFLPPHSVRFFRVDEVWLDALIDGAISIGGGTSVEQVMCRATGASVHGGRGLDLHSVRRKRMHRNHVVQCGAPREITSEEITGFIMKSPLVCYYKGLEVKGNFGSAERNLLRLSVLSDDVMLALFDGTVDTVRLIEPSEGLHFGAATAKREIYPRRTVAGGGQQIGDRLSAEPLTIPMRDDRMVDAAKLAQVIQARLGSACTTFTPAEFAMEMIQMASRATITKGGTTHASTH